MTINKLNQPNWKPQRLWQRLGLTLPERNQLLETLSLTDKFKSQYADVQVTILAQGWDYPLNYERIQLNLPLGQKTWVRCVMLSSKDQPLLYARTIIPNLTRANPWFGLKKLGNQPLGEVLFSLKQIKRSSFSIQKSTNDWPHLYPLNKPRSLLARHSTFLNQGSLLLLTEVFLAKIKPF